MDEQIATLIINHIDSRIDDLKENSNNNFNLLADGMRKMHDRFEAHEKTDTEAFTDIKIAIASTKATQTAIASTKAKFWASVCSLVTLAIALAAVIFHRA